MGIFQTYGKVANEKGHKNESRILMSLQNENLPSWMTGISKTPDYFPNFDFVIQTDVGPLYLQVKSSRNGKLKFADKLGEKSKNIACVVIKSHDSEELIKNKVLSSVGELRKRFLQERNL